MSKRKSLSSRRDPSRSTSPPAASTSPVVRYKIGAILLEDAHLGTGLGSAGLHALVARDRHSNPVIWATHLEGLLREAAMKLHGEAYAKSLFGASGGQQASVVPRATVRRASVVLTSLYHVETNGAPPSAGRKEHAWVSRVWRSTARVGRVEASKEDDSRTFENRAPQSDTLRAIEHVPKGTAFEGFVEVPHTLERAALVRLLAEVDAVGRGRASGAGQIKLSLLDDPREPRGMPGGTCARWRLRLRNCDPLCITATAHPGNLIPTESYIPGRTLLGALTSSLLSVGQDEAAALLVSEKVRVGDALPVPDALSRRSLAELEVLPAPLALQTTKDKSPGSLGGVPWWVEPSAPTPRLNVIAPKKEKSKPSQEKTKRPADDLYIARAGGAWMAYRPMSSARLRCGRPDPRKPDPQLFAIEQLAEDTRFVADVEGDPQDLERLWRALRPVLTAERWLRVGRAGVAVEIEAIEPIPRRGQPKISGDEAYLTLTSDLLLRDPQLRWRTKLAERGSFALPAKGRSIDVEIMEIKQDEAAINAFNGTARLWRLPAAAIRRGTVARIKGRESIAALLEASAQGHWLGERIHEGFGRFRIDDELPGMSTSAPPAGIARPSATSTAKGKPSPQEAACAATATWWESEGAKRWFAPEAPSLSQWFDLCTALDEEAASQSPAKAGPSPAIKRRLEGKTLGLGAWKAKEAHQILKRLNEQQDGESRRLYARLFVRRLRAEHRTRPEKSEGGES